MSEDVGRSVPDGLSSLRDGAAGASPPKASSPSADYERDLARRLHAAAIVKGKAEAELERNPLDGRPVAFRMRALSGVALAHIKWLRIYIEACQYFDDQRIEAQAIGTADAPEPTPLQSETPNVD